ncbi:MAG: hypothetical protein PHG29_12025, partial [Prolixibacteraceae bacterium]|nr:hypothetical protein [Prolixibacteraceae bacterium]
KIWSDSEIDFFDFNPAAGELLYVKNGVLTRMSPDNLTVISEMAVNGYHFFDIDWNNNEYVSLNEERDLISIYNLNSGELKKEVKTFNFGHATSNFTSLYLSNKILFTEGLRLKLIY